jgi:hypothetical protein
MPKTRASDMAIPSEHVSSHPGGDIAKVREVGALVSKRLAYAPCLRLARANGRVLFHGPHVVRRVSRQARCPRQSNQQFWLPHSVTPINWHVLAGRPPGIQGRVIMGRAVYALGVA